MVQVMKLKGKRSVTKRQLRLRRRRRKLCISLAILISLFVYIGIHVIGGTELPEKDKTDVYKRQA